MYNQWAVKPSLAVMEMVTKYLEEAHLFESESSVFDRNLPEYRFTTTIHQLEVIEIQDQFSAHLNLEFQILNNSDNHILLHHEADRINPFLRKT